MATKRRKKRAPARRRRRANPSMTSYRKSPKRVAAGKKAARTRKRRMSASGRVRKLRTMAWRKIKSPKRRMTVKRTTRGLMRSPISRIGYSKRGTKLRVNPRRRYRRRRNPSNIVTRMLGRWRMDRAIPILVGFVGGVGLKPTVMQFLIPKLPITMQMPVSKWFGVLTIMAGALLSGRGRRSMTKDAGLGLIVAGLYDIIATNFADLPFIPRLTVSMPASAETTSGRMGASIGQGMFTTVGAASLNMDMEPEIVGEMDLDDLI